MKEKNIILDYLNEEHQILISRRDELMNKVEVERDEYEEDEPNPVLDDCISELHSIVDNIFHLENAIRHVKSNAAQARKKGDVVKIGDLITLKDKQQKKQVYISHSFGYVNPRLGIISPDSPIGQAVLGSKIGETISLCLNGNNLSYELTP